MGFTKAMATRLAELVKDKQDDLFPSSLKKDALKTQHDAWDSVTTTLNGENPDNKNSIAQVKTKWKNIKQEAKEAFQKSKREANKTGGGSPLVESSSASEIAQEMFSSRPSFEGVPYGVETGLDFEDTVQMVNIDAVADVNSAKESIPSPSTPFKTPKRSHTMTEELKPKRSRQLSLEDLRRTVLEKELEKLEQDLENGKKFSMVLDKAAKFFDSH